MTVNFGNPELSYLAQFVIYLVGVALFSVFGGWRAEEHDDPLAAPAIAIIWPVLLLPVTLLVLASLIAQLSRRVRSMLKLPPSEG